jgi:hypothetical protein
LGLSLDRRAQLGLDVVTDCPVELDVASHHTDELAGDLSEDVVALDLDRRLVGGDRVVEGWLCLGSFSVMATPSRCGCRSTTPSGSCTCSDDLIDMLRAHIDTFLPDESPNRWLFSVSDGSMYDNDIDWRWRATRNSVGLPHVRLHDLRHFYASGLIAAGCDVVTVQRALGHSSATTTLNTYSHLWPTAEDRDERQPAI